MSCAKEPGADEFMTEYKKFGGPVLLALVYAVVTAVWNKAGRADKKQKLANQMEGRNNFSALYGSERGKDATKTIGEAQHFFRLVLN